MTRKLVVGNVPRKVLPPTTVRPPTASGSPSSFRAVAANESNTGFEHQLNIPLGTQSGDLLVYIGNLAQSTDREVNTPTGWTELIDSGGGTGSVWVYVMYRVADGTETDTTFTTNLDVGFDGTSSCTIAIRPAPGVAFQIDSAIQSITNSTTTPSFPQVTVTSGNTQYLVFGAALFNDTAGGYDMTDYGGMTERYDSGLSASAPRVIVASEQQTASSTYTPADWTADSSGNNYFTVTLAVNGAAAEVASATHTHTEADVTDLDHWTETDHDALDHTGLTGVGVSDHGGLSGLTDDDHTQYTKADGTRAFSGDQSMGSNKLTNVTDPTSAQDAATKAYVDANISGDYYEVIVSGSAPPVAVTNEAADDWLYGLVP